MIETDVEIVDYKSDFGPELVRMWRDSFERAVGVTDTHPLSEQLNYLDEIVAKENRVVVVMDKATAQIIGFMAFTPDKISQLYVHVQHQRRGIGSMLLKMAKQYSSGRLRLFTFKANEGAQRFYEYYGFRVIARSFEEDWQLEDVEYEWILPKRQRDCESAIGAGCLGALIGSIIVTIIGWIIMSMTYPGFSTDGQSGMIVFATVPIGAVLGFVVGFIDK